jgi:hypothetical protein
MLEANPLWKEAGDAGDRVLNQSVCPVAQLTGKQSKEEVTYGSLVFDQTVDNLPRS